MIDALILASFLAACAALGLRARRRGGIEDYVLASRALTLPQFVASLVPTFYGGVLGVGEFTWTNGLSNWTVMAFPYYVLSAAYALLLAERVRLAPGLTIPDHLESAYGRPLALLGAVLVFLLAAPADELLMAGTLLSHISAVELTLCCSIAALAAIVILWNGGLPSDVAANRLQFVAMFLGFALILPFAVSKIGPLSSQLPPSHLSWTGGLPPIRILAWWLIAVWTIVDPSFHQRCAAAESPAVARKGILISIAFWALFDLMTTGAGLYARAALPALDAPTLAFPRLADAVLPSVARGVFFAGVSASLFAALQGTMLLSAASLGKDLLGRLSPVDDASPRVRLSLVASAGISLALALAMPSVVQLWYAIGGVIVPGLLLPMLGVYFPALRARPRWAAASSVAGVSVSAACLLAGSWLEPAFAGLAAAAALWAGGLRR